MIVTVLMILMVAAALDACYLLGLRHKEVVTENEENPGYRNAAIVNQVKELTFWRLLKSSPWSVHFLIGQFVFFGVAMVVVSSGGVNEWIGQTASSTYHAVAPRYDEVPYGHRGIVVDRHGRLQPGSAVLNPGSHFVFSNERISLVDCSAGTDEEVEVTARTPDRYTFEMRVRGSVRFRCNDWAVHRVVERFGGTPADVIDADDAWDSYVVPVVRNSFRDSVRGRTAEYVSENMDEIMAGVLRRLDTVSDVDVSLRYSEVTVRGSQRTESRPTLSISEVRIPGL
ncbi:MAG: SPFH domain-containing protein [Patescibacteria group bacterium]|nr:SPFH domain-containing protein [Patescibacteria group bacterium]